MLTADLAQSWQRAGRVRPLYIPPDDPNYLQDAAALIELFSAHEGRARRELDAALEEYVGTGTDYKIMRGLIKLLMDRCEFVTASVKDPVEIRRALFLKAREHHPVTGEDDLLRRRVLEDVGREIEYQPEAILEGLYADLPENQKLAGFERPTPIELLDRYNLAQAQALLYRSVEMRIFVEPQSAEGYRELFGAIKAYRLIHSIRGSASEGYSVRLDGPVSLFHRSQKYGVQMAVFLPALLLCQKWRMQAEIAPHNSSNQKTRAVFELTSKQNQLRSHYLSALTLKANSMQEELMEDWARFESVWQLDLSSEVISLGESAFIPDFALTNAEGERVYLEILGFWTPQYLEERLKEFEHAGLKNFLLAAWDELRGSRDPYVSESPHTIIFKRKLEPARVELALSELLSH